MKSMTGFGRVSGTIGGSLSISISVRSVNHRYLETSIRLPEILWELEPMVRGLVSAELRRGKVDVSVRLQQGESGGSSVRFDRDLATAVAGELDRFRVALGLSGEIALRDILQIPGVVVPEPAVAEIDQTLRDEFAELMRAAISEVSTMRIEEGRNMRVDIAARIDEVSSLSEDLEEHREAFVRESVESYRQRVMELASASGVEIEQDRLAQETVLMVEKGDIAEEIARIASHVQQAKTLVESDEADGKKLDFLAQEMLREINTIGSKSRSAEIRNVVIELKTRVERIREQAQNVE